MKKIITTIFFPILLVSFLSAQNLVELAKKEKERRAKIKNKTGIVITNADLILLKKSPSLTIIRAAIPRVASPATTTPIRTTGRTPGSIDRGSGDTLAELEDKWRKAEEYVDLLTLKINGLQQRFFSFRDWTLRDDMQREMAATFDKLQKARLDAEKAKQEYEQQRRRRR